MSDEQVAKVVFRDKANHRSWGDDCDAWDLLSESELAVTAESMPPSTQESPHRHEHANQFFYVLRGELTMEIETETLTMTSRQGILVSAGLVHQARNDGTEPVDFLVIAGPAAVQDRIAAPLPPKPIRSIPRSFASPDGE